MSIQQTCFSSFKEVERNLACLANAQASNSLSLMTCSDHLIGIQNQIETIKQLFPESIFSKDNFDILFHCQKTLLKLQSKTIRLASLTIEDKQGLYLKVSEVWSRTVQRFGPDVELGKSLWENHAKDQLNLQGLNEFLHAEEQKKMDRIAKLTQEGKWQEANEIASFLTKALPNPIAEAIRTKTPYVGQTASSPAATLNIRRFFCTKVSVLDVSKLELCESDQHKALFYPLLFHKISKLVPEAKLNEQWLHRFIRQNREHPIVYEAIDEYILKRFFKPYVNVPEQSLMAHINTLPGFLQAEIHNQVKRFVYQTDVNHLVILFKDATQLKIPIESELAKFAILQAAFNRYAETLRQNISNFNEFKHTKEIIKHPDLFYYVEIIGNVETSQFFQSAFRAFVHTITTINYSANYLNKVDTCYNSENFSPKSINSIINKIGNLRKAIIIDQEKKISSNCDCLASRRNLTNCASSDCYYLDLGNLFFKLVQQDKSIPYARLGNCGEFSTLSFKYLLREQNPSLTFGRCSIEKGDHSLLVVGMRRESDPQNPLTWGPDAVVLDPWARKIYLLNDLPKILKSYKGVNLETGLPVFESYNPTANPIKLIAGNFVTANQLKKIDTSNFSDEEMEAFESIELLLNLFFKETDRKEQRSIAEEILFILDDENATFSKIEETMTLRSQMQYFLTSKVGNKAEAIMKEMLEGSFLLRQLSTEHSSQIQDASASINN